MTADPKIVVLDDSPEMLAAIRRVLHASAAVVRTTTDPHQALAWVAAGDIALVISDYDMPVMNGIEVVAEVCRRSPTTVRVLMTGHHELGVAVEGINRGEIFRYVQKPLDEVRIRTLVADALARHRELAATAVDRARAVQTEVAHRELETAYPGIQTVVRADDGTYPVSSDLNAALDLLGLSSDLMSSPSLTGPRRPTASDVEMFARHDPCSSSDHE